MKPDVMVRIHSGSGGPGTASRQERPAFATPFRALYAVAVLLAILLVTSQPALAEDEFFGENSPLLIFVDFMTGPFAYGVVIVALVATVGALTVGGEFAGFARRMPIVVVAGAIVILASTVIKNLFGADRAADVPVKADAGEPLIPPASDAIPFPQPCPEPDALPHCMPMDHGWLIIAGIVLVAMTIGVLGNWCCDIVGNIRARRRSDGPGDIA